MIDQTRVATSVACLAGLGHLRPAPGTIASAYTAALCYVLLVYTSPIAIYGLTLVAIILSLWSVGVWHRAQADQAIDQSWIVIDEVAGQSLVFWYIFSNDWRWTLAAFVLFRFFDILKPWPISWADRQFKTSFGVLFDDLLAGIFAGLILFGMQVYAL